MVPLKYLSNFSRTLEIPIINCKISLVVGTTANQNSEFQITDTKFYVPVVTL